MTLSKGFVYCLKCKVCCRIDISEVVQPNVIEKITAGKEKGPCGGLMDLLAVMTLVTDKLI